LIFLCFPSYYNFSAFAGFTAAAISVRFTVTFLKSLKGKGASMADKVGTKQIQWLDDYQQALSRAKELHKPVYLDFWYGG
jgi:hypothetical protein